MIQYERIKYPDGQISVKQIALLDSFIKERINSYEDLFYVRSIAEILGKVSKTLYIPCLFGQRSDRRFGTEQSFDLKIICEFINSMGFDRVYIFDPHSDVSLALINNSQKETSFNFVRASVEDINSSDITLVSPDGGAYKKVFEYGHKLNIPVVAASKYRDKDGDISLVFVGDVKDKHCLIVDDICDGGYTFYLLSKALKEQGAAVVDLYVSHGYFSKWFNTKLTDDPDSTLQRCLHRIYCTNSVKDISDDWFDGYKTRSLNGLVKQYKII